MGDQGDAKVKFRGVGWVVIRSHHRDRLADFYRALGFVQASISKNVVGLYAGRQAGLEIGHLDSNAAPAQPKTSRTQATMVAVFGTTNVKEVVARAEKAGATMIEKIFSEGNENLYYIGDPDGNVVGFSEVGPMWRE
jgi:predicted enzyme related to lactoylglutathione lyase